MKKTAQEQFDILHNVVWNLFWVSFGKYIAMFLDRRYK